MRVALVVKMFHTKIMRQHMKYIFLSALLLLLAAASWSCAALSPEIHTQDAVEKEITGNFSVMVCSGWYESDPISVAILNKEDSPYSLDAHSPYFSCSTLKQLPAKDGLVAAYGALSRNPDFARPQFARIIDKSGRVFGYEVRPLFHAFRYGEPDILDIFYWRKGDKIMVDIRVLHKEER